MAFGGQLKNTFCVTRGNEAFLSQHIGDMDEVAAIEFQKEALDKMVNDLPEKNDVIVRIMKKEVGNVNDDDIKIAGTCNAKIITFRVKADANIVRMADDRKIKIIGILY
jgi:translation initiation factor IF-2